MGSCYEEVGINLCKDFLRVWIHFRIIPLGGKEARVITQQCPPFISQYIWPHHTQAS